MTSPDRESVTKWLLGLFAAVLLVLLGVAVTGEAENRKVNQVQDLRLQYLQVIDSVWAVGWSAHLLAVNEIRFKVDSILHYQRR